VYWNDHAAEGLTMSLTMVASEKRKSAVGTAIF
jgi:hypothetical protein